MTHFYTNYQILPPKKLKNIYFFSNFTLLTDTAVAKKQQKESSCILPYSL